MLGYAVKVRSGLVVLFIGFCTRIEDIFWHIEVFYNRKRRRQALGYLSPLEFKRSKELLAA
ncbi:MAG TPA: hypothetical protein DCW46_08415 [Desulfotomaculum sp.]|nr:hypothetical protein [Desulfotomaculum sp.]